MKFVAFERSMQGTGASRRLRNSGKTPGIVYGGVDQQPQLVELDHNALWHALKKEAFHASILDMELSGKETKVLLRDFQMHPYKQLVLHIDFQRVDAKTTLNRKVPIHYSGEETSPAVKVDACLINHITDIFYSGTNRAKHMERTLYFVGNDVSNGCLPYTRWTP